MICKNCGADVPDGSRFCPKCGQRTEAQEPASVGAQGGSSPVSRPGSDVRPSETGNAQAAGSIKKPSKNSIIGICAVAIVIILVVIIVSVAVGSKPTIDLNDFVVVEFSGYNGYGRATAHIDWAGIEDKYGEKLSLTDKAKDELQDFVSLVSPVDVIERYVGFSLDQRENLKNGDEVTCSWEVDDELTEYVKCKVKYSDAKSTVEGLEKVTTFDPFADMEVTFSGISPNGYASFSYTGSTLNDYAFTCEGGGSNLKNGDTVTVSLNNTDAEYYVTNYGMVPESTSKSYVVEGLDEYVESYEALPADLIDNLRSEAEDTIVSYAANSYNSTSSLSDLTYAGYVFGVAKDSTSWQNNYLYIIMSGTVSSSTGDFKPGKVYFPVRYDNFLHGSDGYNFDPDNNVTGQSSLDGGYYTKGYRNPLNCYIDLVESNRDSYTIESGDGFEVYADYDLISKLADISDTYKDTLISEAKDTIESYIASNYDEEISVSDLKVMGEYLLLAKNQGTDFANNNKYFLVFSATATSSTDKFEAMPVYFPLEYDGVVKLPGDEYMVTTTQRNILGSFSFPGYWRSSRGYISGETMYSEIITRNRSSFTYEVSKDLQPFGN